ncbi:MAG TPA: SUMF1/EgtB/PvdO family nonheme iron enzyme [Flavobacteriales bacterium]|nr:SUMF1/EgtB/PvdO family nonheme iron enzyme [Flavobacteriales bacterium]HRE95483.1 SUMF1/EgtB/PvdO family nonheme iron enzyme [Flavobacteriales bacterium]HRJ40146.1 SUMF1/EgtB/PvdO family nonheme iron enzyme [Flavobacteriales bacterium]
MKIILAGIFLLALPFEGMSKDKLEIINASYIEKMMKWIPGGTVKMAPIQETIGEKGTEFTVENFYMQEAEVSNFQYVSFLYDLVKKADTNSLRKAIPDTTVWIEKHAYMNSFVEHYLRHPAYRNYPVVGISYEQTKMFCIWLTERYNADPKRKHKEVLFELPTETEWMNAASGGMNSAIFPWGGHYLRNAKGEYLANFSQINEASIIPDSCGGQKVFRYVPSGASAFDGAPLDDTYITAPVRSYWPNGFGMYNMAGNVAEFVSEEGIVKGGSWQDTGYFLQITARQYYDKKKSASSKRGFRIKMIVKK